MRNGPSFLASSPWSQKELGFIVKAMRQRQQRQQFRVLNVALAILPSRLHTRARAHTTASSSNAGASPTPH
ncbi:unnamed protein product [Lampetra planeri]